MRQDREAVVKDVPLQVSFHGLEPSPALRSLIEGETAKLKHLYRYIVTCHVTVEHLAGRHRKGNPFRVRIELAVPGKRLTVDSQPNTRRVLENVEEIARAKSDEVHPEHKDGVLATRDAFRKLGRQLQDYARRQRADVKTHLSQPEGRVIRLFPTAGYGFIEGRDGREIYFNRASVLNDGFDQLSVDARVSFVEEEGDKGPQASTVRLV